MSTRLALLLCAAGLVFCALAATGVLPATEDAPRSLLDPAPHPEPEEPLANGVYEVVASSFRREELALLDDDSVVRVYDGQFVRGRDAHPPEYVLLRTRGYAPLLLSRPAKVVDPHGSPKLHMTLTTEAGTALHALTGRAKLAAVVVGDAIVTVHRIRVAIEGGLLQVSCWAAGALERLHRQLSVVPPTWAQVSEQQIKAARELGLPVAFEHHAGLRFVLLPPGRFTMGSPPDEGGRRSDEAARVVEFPRAFYMQVGEVSNAQVRSWRRARKHSSGRLGEHGLDGDDQPAVLIPWPGAMSFAHWLSETDLDHDFVLPTEAAWEYACRAGTTTRFPWGEHLADGPRHANANDSKTRALLHIPGPAWERDDGYRVSAPAAAFPPNAWGLRAMPGNVLEWCADHYVGPRVPFSPQGEVPSRRKHEFTSWADPGVPRVLRGGSWFLGPLECRSAARRAEGANARSVHIGFRLMAVPKPRREAGASTDRR